MKKENIGSVKIIPLGGLEQIGMNITAIEYDDSIVVVDCGLSFPEEEMLGIDLVIPDVTYLKENPSEVLNTIIRSLNKEGAAVLFSMTPQTTMPTNAFTLCLPEKLNDYQIKVLNSISSEEIEFFDIAVLNNEYDSILSDNDFGRTNGYVLDEYLKNLQRGRI